MSAVGRPPAVWITAAPGVDIGLGTSSTGSPIVGVRVNGQMIGLNPHAATSTAKLLAGMADFAACGYRPASVESDRPVVLVMTADAERDARADGQVDPAVPVAVDLDQVAAAQGGSNLVEQGGFVGGFTQPQVDAVVGDDGAHDDSLSHGSVGTAEGKGEGPGAAETSRPADDGGLS